MVHCSGGAQTKVLSFLGSGQQVIKDNLFTVPPLFETIREQSETPWEEMYKVFNMGHRMELYMDERYFKRVRFENVSQSVFSRLLKPKIITSFPVLTGNRLETRARSLISLEGSAWTPK